MRQEEIYTGELGSQRDLKGAKRKSSHRKGVEGEDATVGPRSGEY